MTYQLPPDVESRIQQRVMNVVGTNEDDILRQALDALDWLDQEAIAIQEGIDDMETGRVKSLREFDTEFRARKNIPRDA